MSDTFGRAWRAGQTDVAVGAAGIEVLDDHAGRVDAYGNPLLVTAPAVADQVTGAAELAQGKTTGVPAAVVRGLASGCCRRASTGPGAAALVRAEADDMFGLGSREAVLAALARGHGRGFGAPGTGRGAARRLRHRSAWPASAAGDGASGCPLPAELTSRRQGRGDGSRPSPRAHGWDADPLRTVADAIDRSVAATP